MSVSRIAMISVHTSPLAPMGGKKTGGMNVYIRELAAELGKRGIEVDVFTRRSLFEEPAVDETLGENVRVIYLNVGAPEPLSPEEHYPYLSEFTAKLIAFAMRHNITYDVIYSHYWLSGWVANKLKEAWGIPFVQMFHTLGHMKQRIIANERVYLPDVRINTETELVMSANRIIAATPAELTQLIWLYRANKRRIEVIPPGVNLERFRPIARHEAKQQAGFGECERILLFVGRIEPLKAVDTILEALHLVRQQAENLLHNVCLAIIGGNPEDTADKEMQRLQQLCCTLQLDDVVKFMGARDQTQLPLYYASATAVIMPSDYESFGMVALEAMASGTPVIATEVGGLAFLIEDHQTGYHVPVREPQMLAERIRWLLADETKSEQMGRNAAQAAQDYAWANIADRLLTVFEEVKHEKPFNRRTS